MTDVNDLERTFARTALLARLTLPERRRLASLAATRSYPAGATILRQGDTSMALYVILSGRVAVQVGSGQAIREIGPDGFFGELGVIDDSPRSATIVALEPTECALLGAWDVRRNPKIALSLLPVLAQQIRGVAGRDARGDMEWLDGLAD
jgi:CRP-like cAMP-binding protein